MKRDNAAKVVLSAIDDALIEEQSQREARDYLGASAVGSHCQRRVQLEYMKAPGDPGWTFSPETLRIFERGHLAEDMMARWFRLAGFNLRTHKSDGSQFRFETANGKFAGHCDGVFLSGPGIAGPTLWEHKSVGAKAFKTMVNANDIKKVKPEYYAQMQTYMAYMQLSDNPGLFSALNMDSMEIHIEFVKFRRRDAQAATDLAVDIIRDSEAGALRPRCSDELDYWACSNSKGKCKFYNTCKGGQ